MEPADSFTQPCASRRRDCRGTGCDTARVRSPRGAVRGSVARRVPREAAPPGEGCRQRPAPGSREMTRGRDRLRRTVRRASDGSSPRSAERIGVPLAPPGRDDNADAGAPDGQQQPRPHRRRLLLNGCRHKGGDVDRRQHFFHHERDGRLHNVWRRPPLKLFADAHQRGQQHEKLDRRRRPQPAAHARSVSRNASVAIQTAITKSVDCQRWFMTSAARPTHSSRAAVLQALLQRLFGFLDVVERQPAGVDEPRHHRLRPPAKEAEQLIDERRVCLVSRNRRPRRCSPC